MKHRPATAALGSVIALIANVSAAMDRPHQARIDPRLVEHADFVDPGNFPALSADNTEVALLYSPDADERALAFDIVRVADGTRLWHTVLLTEAEGAWPRRLLDADFRERISAANEYLSRKRFRVLQPLFRIGEAIEHFPIYEVHSFDTRITFDHRTGVLTIGNIVAGEGESWEYPLVPLRFATDTVYFQRRWPLAVERTCPGDDQRRCTARPIPEQGWVNRDWQQRFPKAMVIRIRHDAEPACRPPDQWWVGPLHSTPQRGGVRAAPAAIIPARRGPENRPPTADPGADSNAPVGVPFILDGGASSDPDGDPLFFHWWIGQRPDGSGIRLFDATTANPVLVPNRAGDYVLHLLVSDGEYVSDIATVRITATGELTRRTWIGPTGGAVGWPAGASVLVPPGALTTATQISVDRIAPPEVDELPPGAVVADPIYDFKPDDQSFQRPVLLVMPYTFEGLLPGDGYHPRIARRPGPGSTMEFADDPAGDQDAYALEVDTEQRVMSIYLHKF